MDAFDISYPPAWIISIHANRTLIFTDYEKVKKANVKDLPLLIGHVEGRARDLLTQRLKNGK